VQNCLTQLLVTVIIGFEQVIGLSPSRRTRLMDCQVKGLYTWHSFWAGIQKSPTSLVWENGRTEQRPDVEGSVPDGGAFNEGPNG
jgi:hypothetical protein